MIRAMGIFAAIALALGVGLAHAEDASIESPALEQMKDGPFKDVTKEQWMDLVAGRMETAVARLGLSDEQVERIKPIMFDQLGQVRELLPQLEEATGLTRLQLMRELMVMRDSTQSRVDELLTDEQQVIADEMRAERQARTRAAMQRYRAGETQALREEMLPELTEKPEPAPAE